MGRHSSPSTAPAKAARRSYLGWEYLTALLAGHVEWARGCLELMLGRSRGTAAPDPIASGSLAVARPASPCSVVAPKHVLSVAQREKPDGRSGHRSPSARREERWCQPTRGRSRRRRGGPSRSTGRPHISRSCPPDLSSDPVTIGCGPSKSGAGTVRSAPTPGPTWASLTLKPGSGRWN